MQINVEVKTEDALKVQTDVLVLKYAQALYGVDYLVANHLAKFHQDLLLSLPEVGQCKLVESYGSLGAKAVLFVGVVPLHRLGYQEVREFARKALSYLEQVTPKTKNICLTLHGVESSFRLDESESFESEIAGCVDAVASGRLPRFLERITIAEIKDDRAERLREQLSQLFPEGVIRVDSKGFLANIPEVASERLRSVGYASESKPFVFVAMPFNDKMDDVFHYGIRGAVNKAGFLCERADLSSFTGDIMDWVKKRIRNAAFVIGDLTTANPNVYLEVGFAWGCDIPTILLVQDTAELKFDVKGQRCIVYKSIKHLEENLQKELENLQPQ